jgi:hypothetical protein
VIWAGRGVFINGLAGFEGTILFGSVYNDGRSQSQQAVHGPAVSIGVHER